MKFKKGDKVTVHCNRKGVYDAVVTADFDTEDEWYEVAIDQDKPVYGANKDWFRGDRIPCRKGGARVEKRAG